MGYEVWDRDERALIADFDDQNRALDFLREMVRPMNVEVAARALDSMQLVRVTNDGNTTEVISAGIDLLTLIFAPAVAH
jgi:hypothetical protein